MRKVGRVGRFSAVLVGYKRRIVENFAVCVSPRCGAISHKMRSFFALGAHLI